MNLSGLLKGVELVRFSGNPETEVSSVVYDSRKASPGCVFVAVPGAKADGTRFIPDAVDAGASAVVFERYGGRVPEGVALVEVLDSRLAMAMMAAEFYGRPSEKLKLVGITGTNGKTTTSYLVKSVLETTGMGVGLVGTISYQVAGKVLPAPNTTPESVDMQRMLKDMLDAGAGYAVLEVSSHAVSLKRVAGLLFSVKVFTNFTQDHLDFHGSMEEYYAAKKSFFMSPGGVSVLNLDDPKGWDIAASCPGGTINYGIEVPADVCARDLELSADGLSFNLVTPAGEARISSALVGRHNVYNILAAAGACTALGLGPGEIAAGVAALKGVPGRFERVEAGQDFSLLVDYAHTEDALARAAKAAREITAGRLITVFGCGGDRDAGKRPKMGYAASLLSDVVVLTSDNPRTEDPARIIAQVEAGIIEEGSKKKEEGYFVRPDRTEAIRFAVGLAGPGDTLLLAGKGHENYQIIGDKKHAFDDRAVARQAVLESLGRRG